MTALSDFIGIPYRSRGDSFAGCDCWGLVWLYSRLVLGREIPRYGDYADASGPDIPQRIREGWEAWLPVPIDQAVEGDVLVFRIGQQPVHVGIVATPAQMLHVLEGRNAVLEPFRTGFWRSAFVRAGRWKS
jgi:cell wall-associated NlpC family hydrolase